MDSGLQGESIPEGVPGEPEGFEENREAMATGSRGGVCGGGIMVNQSKFFTSLPYFLKSASIRSIWHSSFTTNVTESGIPNQNKSDTSSKVHSPNTHRNPTSGYSDISTQLYSREATENQCSNTECPQFQLLPFFHPISHQRDNALPSVNCAQCFTLLSAKSE